MPTPIQLIGGYYFKRDDFFRLENSCGTKVRACLIIAAKATKGLVTSGSRASPQINIVATVAQYLGLHCVAHTQGGALFPEVQRAVDRGAKIIQHGACYNNIIIKRAREYAEKTGYTEVPFGMECQESVSMLSNEVKDFRNRLLPSDMRIVVPVGSGMFLAALVANLIEHKICYPIVAVRVDCNSGFTSAHRRLDKYAPTWRLVNYPIEFVKSNLPYDKPSPHKTLCGVYLDPIYEAKCVPFMRKNDMIWVVGCRETATEKQQAKKI